MKYLDTSFFLRGWAKEKMKKKIPARRSWLAGMLVSM